MQEVSVRPNLLECVQIATLMVNAGHAIAHEHLRDIGHPVAGALLLLCRSKGGPFADVAEGGRSPIGNAAVEFTVRILVESSSRRIGSGLVDIRHLQGLAVIEGGVAATMMNRDRMVFGRLIERGHTEKAALLYMG